MSPRNYSQHGGTPHKNHIQHHTRHVARSAGNSLNPTVGNFKPHPMPTQAHSTTLVPRKEEPAEDDQEIQILASELKNLTNFFNDEIISLRRDIEVLKQGGWTVTVGPFQPANEIDYSEVEATRQRLQNSCGLLGALTTNSHTLSPTRANRFEAPPVEPAAQDDTRLGASTEALIQEIARSNDPFITTLDNDNKAAPNRAEQVAPRGVSQTNGVTHNSASKPIQQPPSPPKEADPDTPLPSIEDPSRVHMASRGNWQPLAIRRLSALPSDQLARIPNASTMKTFSWELLQSLFGSNQWSPGFYYMLAKEGVSILPSRSFYVLDAKNEPYLPPFPGAHGAKLTAFFNPANPSDVDGEDAANAYMEVPLFVANSPSGKKANTPSQAPEFIYFGMYSQLRFSDRLDFDRMVEQVPAAVKMDWAEQLADLARPEWVTEALMKAFVPKPEYEGPLPGPHAENDVVRKEVGRHVRDLKEWEEEAREKAGELTKESILEAFEKEDAAEPPGLRLWWEYLQCVGWDAGLYDMLVREQLKFDSGK